MLQEKTLYNLNDVCIVPAKISDIVSRKDCNTYYENNKLPIFTAPMDTVVGPENLHAWLKYGITPIIPRTIDINQRLDLCCIVNQWIAVSLNEFNEYFRYDLKKYSGKELKILIDIANGHMKQIYTAVNDAKKLAKENNVKLILMVGNIANPDTYRWICRYCDVDYVRCGIGTGTVCTTSSQTAIHYPMASLIDECFSIKLDIKVYENLHDIDSPYKNYKSAPKIVADGGIRTYADAIKALALGADYVMIGSAFASVYESISKFYSGKNIELDNPSVKILSFEHYLNNENDLKYSIQDEDIKLKKEIIRQQNGLIKRTYGMSTPEAQKKIDDSKNIKITEGRDKWLLCSKTLYDWVNEFTAYLRSCMSYTNISELKDFIGKPNTYIMSNTTINAINKPIDNIISFDY